MDIVIVSSDTVKRKNACSLCFYVLYGMITNITYNNQNFVKFLLDSENDMNFVFKIDNM